MPIEIYIAILAASLCIILLTVAFIVAAVYFKAQVSSIEKEVTQLESELSGLIAASQELVRKAQKVVVGASGVMDDVGKMTRTVSGWGDRADRMVDVVASATQPPVQRVSKYVKFGSGFLSGIVQPLRTLGNGSWFGRILDMAARKNGSAAPRIMTAFATGALIGGGVAILLAPHSGKRMRNMVADKTNEIKDAADDVIERGRHLANEVKQAG